MCYHSFPLLIAAFFRDLEKYKDTPAVAILKHHNYGDINRMKQLRDNDNNKHSE